MLSIVVWLLGALSTEGLRIGSAGQGEHLPPPTFAQLLFASRQNSGDVEKDEDDDSARGFTLGKPRADLLSLFKKQVKCSDVGLIPLSNECGKYLDCTEPGTNQKTLYCPTGKLFDHLRRECVVGTEARCRGLCRHEGDDYPDPKNPEGYMRCRSGVPVPKRCPHGMEFRVEAGQCADASKEADEYEYSEDDY